MEVLRLKTLYLLHEADRYKESIRHIKDLDKALKVNNLILCLLEDIKNINDLCPLDIVERISMNLDKLRLELDS